MGFVIAIAAAVDVQSPMVSIAENYIICPMTVTAYVCFHKFDSGIIWMDGRIVFDMGGIYFVCVHQQQGKCKL